MTTKKTKLPKNGENAMGTTKDKTQAEKTREKVEELKRGREEYEEELNKAVFQQFEEIRTCSTRIAYAIRALEDAIRRDSRFVDVSDFTKLGILTNVLYMTSFINNLSLGRVTDALYKFFKGRFMMMTEIPDEVQGMMRAETTKKETHDC